MTSASGDLERQIERIHRLLEKDASVRWNERISDPDNPAQARQIDITIRRHSLLTIVECRLHKAAQDVMWIEELMGRKISLRADTVIAVSVSGFTRGAQIKAQKFGIHLRELKELTDQEVLNWGIERKITFVWYEFSQTTIDIGLQVHPIRFPDMRAPDGLAFDWTIALRSVSRKLDAQLTTRMKLRKTQGVAFDIPRLDCRFDGMTARRVRLRSNIRILRTEHVNAPVQLYRDIPNKTVDASVYPFDLGRSEIIEAADGRASVSVDVSKVTHPRSTILHSIEFDMGTPVKAQQFQMIGMFKNSASSRVPIEFRFHGPMKVT